MNEEEEDKFIKENPIVFKKYQVKKKLGEGAFGEVYLGQTIEDKTYVALKVEPKKIAKPILQSEAFLLYSLAGPGIPAVRSFGKVKNYNILVEPLLGKSLFDIYAENHKEMPMEDICLIGKQVIDRIQWIHSKYIVHRDIKPDNFLIGKDDPNVIYLIDFGLSKKYRSSISGKHIRFGFTGKLTGTVRFASANALRGGEQSRRDDIESIGYMLVYFMKKRLPWQGVTGTRKMERYLKIYKLKKNTTPEELCKGLPPEMTEYMTYAKKLEFEQEPNYNYLRKLFNKMLKRLHTTNEQLVFSWIKLNDLPKLKNPVNPSSRKESPQSRIYRKIKNSLERERNLSSDSNDSKHSYQQVFSQAKVHNMQVIKNDNCPESELEQNNEKKINKKALKLKEELNTMVANLDTFVDENVVDFENEVLLRGSKDLGEIASNKNILSNNNNIQSNNDNINFEKEINNDLSNKNKKESEPNKINLVNNNKNMINNYLNNLVDNNEQKDNNDDINKIQNRQDINDFIKNIEKKESNEKDNKMPNNNINNLNLQKNNKISLEKKEIPFEKNNQIIDNNIVNKKGNQNPIFDSINNMFFENDVPIDNNPNDNKNQLEPIDEIPNNNILMNKENDSQIQNNENKVSLKISSLEGREFTFNESLNFKSNFKFEKEMKNNNLLSADKKDNAHSILQNNKNMKDNIIKNNVLNDIKKIPEFSEIDKSKLNQNNLVNNKTNINKNFINNKNNINNKPINENKINQKIQIIKKNPQKIKKINLDNGFQKKLSQDQKVEDINKFNFPKDNIDMKNLDFLSARNIVKNDDNQIKKIIRNFNVNNNNRIKKININNIMNQQRINNNDINKYKDLTFEKNVNLMPNDGMYNNLNNKTFNLEEINKKNVHNNNQAKINKNLNAFPSKKNNNGNNITNININIKNNYVQNNDNNNNNMKIINLDMKKYADLAKNENNNQIICSNINNNIIANKISYPQRNNNVRKVINPNMKNVYPNNQKLQNYQANLQKNNHVKVMINNPNNMNRKKLNNKYIINNRSPKQMLTNQNPNPVAVQVFPNSVKNNYTASHYAFTENNVQNMQRRTNIINPNANIIPSKITMNNYQDINLNNMIGYDNVANTNFDNLQNMKINYGNNQMFKYQ